MFGYRKSNNDKNKKETFQELIVDFDEEAYLDTNEDVRIGIESGQFKNGLHHLETFGLNEIEQGLRKFHKDCEFFNELKYLEVFPELHKLLQEENYNSVFDHFCQVGYIELIKGKMEGQKKVVAILGVPRSGLTLAMSLIGGNCNASTWFLPYSTRKELGIEPFVDFSSIEKEYAEAFPHGKDIRNTLFISESTSDEKNIDFIMKSLKNLKNNNVEVQIIWITRDVHHTYVSQVETAFKYWGAEKLIYDKNNYNTYVDFFKRGYIQLTELACQFDTSLISYERLVEAPFENLQSIYKWLHMGVDIDEKNLLLESNYVAGDPTFQNDGVYKDRSFIREEAWSDMNDMELSLNDSSRLLVSAVKERIELLSIDQNLLPFESYKKTLVENYFDHDFYLDQYSDMADGVDDLIDHYEIFGWKENRNPSPEFETKWYRENIFDDNETPSFLHYLLIGRFLTKPGRSTGIMENLDIIDPKNYVITENLVLEVPKFKDIKVSIIIPAYGQEEYTIAAIESIIKNTDIGVSYEVIVMDDKSPDESARLIEKNLKNVKFISNGVNLGFVLNCNKGASIAKGNYILLLNNDTNVQPGWLSTLIELIESSDDIGMVGSRLVYPTGQQQEAGGIVWDDASGWNFGRLDDPNKPEFNYVKEVDYLSGAAVMIKRSVWEELDGFDERYIPAYYEDTDLSFSVRKLGYRVLYQPKSIVIHFEGISNGTDLGSGIKHYQVVNREKFYNKWETELTGDQYKNGEEVFLARDRSGKKRHLLYVDHYLPHYDHDAGSKATYQYLKIFAESDIQVHFIGDNFYDYPDTPYLDTLQQMGIEVLHGDWYAHHWKDWFAKNGKFFDYVLLSRPHIAPKYLDTIRNHSDAKVIYYGHDLHFLRESREYDVKKDEKYLESSERWKEIEMNLIRDADISYFFSSVEKDEILKIDDEASVNVVPLYIYDTFKQQIKPSSERENVMFVGGFAHSPNVDAILWFVSKVWPKVINKIPNIKLYIIGSKAPEEILALESDSVVVTGYVDDETLDAFYAKTRVAVAPLRYGAGIKGKVVDALYNGMPLVTTSIGAEGLEGSDSIMMLADKSKKFAKHVISLYTDDELADKYAINALEYCKQYFSTDMAREKMSNIFEEFKGKK